MSEGRNSKGQFSKGNTCASGISRAKYKKEYASELIDYFARPPTKEIKRGKKTVTVANEYPMFEGFARKIGVTVRTLENWAAKHREFGEAWERAKDSQRYILVENALFSRYNGSFSKFIAMNHHGMSDKVEREERLVDDKIDVEITMIDEKEKKDEG